jgi:hypothetical protein
MTWHDIYVILSFALTSDEKERVWLAAQAHADDVHCTDLTLLVGSMAIPREDSHWDYQDPRHASHQELDAHLPPCGATIFFPQGS